MLPVYNPKSFASVDLRKYHIRDIQDVIRFNEFVSSRMDEAIFILKKFNTQYATFAAVSSQLKAKVEKEQQSYGAAPKVEEVKEEEDVIQNVDDGAEEKEALLDDIRQAVANQEDTSDLEVATNTDDDERKVAELGKYKVIASKRGPMFYRKGDKGFKLVSQKDVPVDVKERLTEALEAI